MGRPLGGGGPGRGLWWRQGRHDGRAGRTYQLQRASASLGQWTNVGDPVQLTENGQITVPDPLPPAGRGFYRFAVSLTTP